MLFNEYQLQAHSFADYTIPYVGDFVKATKSPTYCTSMREIDYVYPAMGLAEESGEVLGKFAKAVRDEKGEISDERKDAIIKELGDVMWFVSELSTLLNVSLEEVCQKNIDKLTSRRERDKIHGDGDDR